jgi:hypothetical protein
MGRRCDRGARGRGLREQRRHELGARRASDARRIAEEANRKADAAAADAAAARAAAEAAARDAKEANEKADRIFQRSLHK